MAALPRIPDPAEVPAEAVEALLAIPGSETLVFTASASAGPDGIASPFAEALLTAWGPDRATLAELLLFGLAVDAEALPGGDALVASGLVHEVGGRRVASSFRAVPLLGTVFVADAPTGSPDACLPPSPTTMELAMVAPPTAGRVLDVGTGAGALAVAAALGGAGGVVATDVSPRACALARLNAAIAGVAVEVRQGDLLAPVTGDRFDVVVSQPPFLPQPPTVTPIGHLHGGPSGDEVARALLDSVGGVLADGGVVVVRADRPAVAPPYPGAEVSWPGAAPEDLATVYAAVHVPTEGAERDSVAIAYRAYLPPQRGTFVVVGPGVDPAAIEVDQPPRSWPVLLELARASTGPRW
jgi:SAM-dependent methyltransferase